VRSVQFRPPSTTIIKSHSGTFTPGQIGAAYSVVVGNTANVAPTSGVVTVTETIPVGLTLTSMAGTGWVCTSNTCTRSDALIGGASYPPITVKVNVSYHAPSQLTNQVGVSGGGSVSTNASDVTSIIAVPMGLIATVH